MIYGLTHLGVLHTAISLIAVIAGLAGLIRDGRITPDNTLGKVYWVTTVITCLTALGIFQHGGFGKPHALALITLAALAVAALAAKTWLFGKLAPYVEMVCYSATFLFHLIPAITETSTRLPLGAPLLPNADAPQLQVATGALLLLFLAGAGWQVWRLHRAPGLRTA
ncbi:MAG TPA: hypothetical protein VH105_07385 [Burkholderiales bacterium]|nr:hypothetical protein [Burkholderiales bacterium]